MDWLNPTVGPIANFLLVLVNSLIGVAGAGVLFFAVSYAIFFNWRKNQSGRSLMYFVLALVSVLCLVITGVLTQSEYFGRAWIRVLVYAAIAATVWNLSWQLWSNYKRGSSRLLDVERRKASRDESVDVFEKTADRPRRKQTMSSTPTSVVPTTPSQVAKSLLYIALTVAAVFEQAQGHLTLPVILAMVVAAVGVIPVYFAVGTKLKVILAFVLAGVQGLVIIVGNTLTFGDLSHLSSTVWIGLIISAFAAIGIGVVPNTPLPASHANGE